MLLTISLLIFILISIIALVSAGITDLSGTTVGVILVLALDQAGLHHMAAGEAGATHTLATLTTAGAMVLGDILITDGDLDMATHIMDTTVTTLTMAMYSTETTTIPGIITTD